MKTITIITLIKSIYTRKSHFHWIVLTFWWPACWYLYLVFVFSRNLLGRFQAHYWNIRLSSRRPSSSFPNTTVDRRGSNSSDQNTYPNESCLFLWALYKKVAKILFCNMEYFELCASGMARFEQGFYSNIGQYCV